MDTDTTNQLISLLEEMSISLRELASYARQIAEPTEEEIKARLEKSMALAMLLGMSRGNNDPLN